MPVLTLDGFTVSFTLQAMGWCFLLLDLFFVLIDVQGIRQGWWLLILCGQTSLAACISQAIAQ